MVGWLSIFLALLSAIVPALAWQAAPFYPVVSSASSAPIPPDFTPQKGLSYHNPNTGRFWTEDSYEGNGSDPGSLHKYIYCDNNPGNGFDRTGHEFNLGTTMFASNISVTSRAMMAGFFGSIGGLVSAMDTEIGSNFTATQRYPFGELRQ